MAENSTMLAVMLPGQQRLTAIQKALAYFLPEDTEWNAPDSFHITLVYLPNGESDFEADYTIEPFAITVNDLDVWNTDDGQAVVLIVGGSELRRLQRELAQTAIDRGTEIGNYSKPADYTPHITLAYVPNTTPITSIPKLTPFTLAVDQFVLQQWNNTLRTYSLTGQKQVYENGSIEAWSGDGQRPYSVEMLSQEEANYQPLGFSDQQGCASCRWFLPEQHRCHLVKGVIVATGNSDLYMPLRPQEQLQELMEDFTEAMQEAGLEVELEDDLDTKNQKKPGLLARLFSSGKQQQSTPELFPTDTGFKVVGDNLFIAWYSNPYQDRDREWFAEKAIDEDIEFMNETGEYPWLERFHCGKFVKHGQTFAVTKAGRFVVAFGEFDDTPVGHAFKQFYEDNPNQGLSHGFYYDPEYKHDRVYRKFHTFEISTLPPEIAANPFTSFAIKQGANQMAALSEKQLADLKAALDGRLPEGELEAILQAGAKVSAELDQHVAYKATDDEISTKDVLEVVAGLVDSVKSLAEEVKAIKAATPPAKEDDEDEARPEEDEKARADQSGMQDMFKELFSDFVNNHQKQIEQRSEGTKQGADALMDMLIPAAKN